MSFPALLGRILGNLQLHYKLVWLTPVFTKQVLGNWCDLGLEHSAQIQGQPKLRPGIGPKILFGSTVPGGAAREEVSAGIPVLRQADAGRFSSRSYQTSEHLGLHNQRFRARAQFSVNIDGEIMSEDLFFSLDEILCTVCPSLLALCNSIMAVRYVGDSTGVMGVCSPHVK